MGMQINTDFDLYSLGPDGRTGDEGKARDDIVRANNGQFVGVEQDLRR
jgi:hypothetical protein